VDEGAKLLGLPLDSATEHLRSLVEKGFIMTAGAGAETIYRPVIAPRRKSALPGEIWEKLGKKAPIRRFRASISVLSARFYRPGFFRSLFTSPRGAICGSDQPIVVAFPVTEWMLYAGTASFSKILNFVGSLSFLS